MKNKLCLQGEFCLSLWERFACTLCLLSLLKVMLHNRINVVEVKSQTLRSF